MGSVDVKKGSSAVEIPHFESLPQLYGWETENSKGYKIKEQLCGAERPLRVVAVGAGASGICLAKYLPDQLHNVSLSIYEKNPELGGTWYENRCVTQNAQRVAWKLSQRTFYRLMSGAYADHSNRYPGCACDIPSHIYQVILPSF